MSTNKIHFTILAAVLVLMCGRGSLVAQTNYSLFMPGATYNWSTAPWDPAGVPGAADTINVSGTGTANLRLNTATAAVDVFNFEGVANAFVNPDGLAARTFEIGTLNFSNSSGGIRFHDVANTTQNLTLEIGTVNMSSSRFIGFGEWKDVSTGKILNSLTVGTLNLSAGTVSIGAVRRSTNDPLNVNLGALNITGGTLELSRTFGSFDNIILAESLSGTGGTIRVAPNEGGLQQGTLRIVGSADTSYSGFVGNGVGERNVNFEMAGSGTQTLAGSNAYQGTTTVTSGTLKITHAAGLGSTNTGTTVASGGTLAVDGGITVGAEALTLSGAGAAGSGALRSVSGVNAYDGDITLAADASISADAGTLNLTNAGTITGSGFGLTLGGAGDIVVSRVIGTGSGGLIKNGAGTVTLNAANTYTGATEIFGGVLALGAGASVADSSSVVLGHTGTFDVSALESFAVGEGRAIGGAGTITGNVSLLSGAGLMVLDLNSPLTVTGTVTLDDSFGIASLLGPDGNAFDWTDVAPGTYTLLNNGSDFSNIQNWGVENQYSLGNNRFAYFKDGSLQLEVIPEPGTHALLLLAGAGLGAHLMRRRHRRRA